METNDLEKRVIDLDPFEVRDETLDAIETEIRKQTDNDLDHIERFDVLVLDGRPNGGLDSHATIFIDQSSSDDSGGDDP